MARESALWGRLKRAVKSFQETGANSPLHIARIDNSAGAGQPDVEGCFDGRQFWIELKSVMRPAREQTNLHPRSRESQDVWHKDRTLAGGRSHWVLIQVGEGKKAALYLIPGRHYSELKTSEGEYDLLSVCPPSVSPIDAILRASREW